MFWGDFFGDEDAAGEVVAGDGIFRETEGFEATIEEIGVTVTKSAEGWVCFERRGALSFREGGDE